MNKSFSYFYLIKLILIFFISIPNISWSQSKWFEYEDEYSKCLFEDSVGNGNPNGFGRCLNKDTQVYRYRQYINGEEDTGPKFDIAEDKSFISIYQMKSNSQNVYKYTSYNGLEKFNIDTYVDGIANGLSLTQIDSNQNYYIHIKNGLTNINKPIIERRTENINSNKLKLVTEAYFVDRDYTTIPNKYRYIQTQEIKLPEMKIIGGRSLTYKKNENDEDFGHALIVLHSGVSQYLNLDTLDTDGNPLPLTDIDNVDTNLLEFFDLAEEIISQDLLNFQNDNKNLLQYIERVYDFIHDDNFNLKLAKLEEYIDRRMN